MRCNSESLCADDTKLKALNLVPSCQLVLTYDYGSTSTYTITFVGRENLTGGEDVQTSQYPRNQPRSALPASYLKYEPAAVITISGGDDVPLNLDTSFPSLQSWIFDSEASCAVNLFQPGSKRNFGFLDRSGSMMYLPVKPADLTNWLAYFDQGSKVVPKGLEEGGDGYPHYTWHSVVIIPREKMTSQLEKKYGTQEAGFTDCVLASDVRPDLLTGAFPKIAALAGLRKDKKVPRGWISFHKRGNSFGLSVCTGNSAVPKSNAPKGTAFDGDKQHDTVNKPLFKVSKGVEIRGLQDLFCIVEGLLRTL
ncbi:hypothetical protein CYMTET_13436 [Cymbomonas tetramitiformis]|uniref:Uncharacterized protein n=1 Tax=Cymbomonas tetramitiformis TaxID=36881 RepID=A0AAE0GI56_9CHLO|nr:hypothetical protein CYMTET_13436 [Cymbomonas tetramitiformis]